MRRKLNFGIVGAGAIAEVYARAFAESDEAVLGAVADTAPGRAEALAGAAGASSHASCGDMVRRARGLEAAVVCTPPARHLEVCLELLRHGIPVLCEKPLSVDVRGARVMLEAAERAGAPLTVAAKFRFVEDVVRAKRILDEGTIGEPVLFENGFTSPADMRGRWNSDVSVSGGGVLIDHGPHSVDLIRHLCGPVAEIFAVEGARSQGLAVEETVHVVARTTGGVLAIVDLSWSVDKPSDAYLHVRGTLGAVSIGFRESRYRLHSSPDWIAFGGGYDKVRAFREQIDNFSRAIRGEEELLVTAADGLASSEAIEAAYAALATGEWTAVATRDEDRGRMRCRRGVPA